ncbi:MAG: hypothetical protein WD688_10000 [Candidatus Binatia bacterium]
MLWLIGAHKDGSKRFLALEPGYSESKESWALGAAAIEITRGQEVAAELVRDGFRNLLHSGDVFPVPFSGTVVNDRLIRDNHDLIKRWLCAHVRVLLFTRQVPDEVAQIAGKDLKLNADVVIQVRQFMSPDDPIGFTEKGMSPFAGGHAEIRCRLGHSRHLPGR